MNERSSFLASSPAFWHPFFLKLRCNSRNIKLDLFFFFFFFAALGLCCRLWAFLLLWWAGATLPCGVWVSHCGGFSCCGAWAPGTWASVVVAHGLSSCGVQAQLLRGMWDLPGPGLKPVSPALAGGFLTTVPPGKPPCPWFWSSAVIKSPSAHIQRYFMTKKNIHKMWLNEKKNNLIFLGESQQKGGNKAVK